MLIFVSFEVTIVVGSVCFSWDLGPRTYCVSFFGCCYSVCKTQLLWQKKAEVKCYRFLVNDGEVITK